MITEIEDFFSKGCRRCDRFATPDCSVSLHKSIVLELRRICLSAGLEENLKWGHPCYMHADRNVAIIGAFRAGVRLTFFNAALMTDPEGVMERQGPNTQHADMIAIENRDDLTRLEPVVRAYLYEAKAYAEKGIKPVKTAVELELPQELVDALDADPELFEAFHKLTPGRQKSYVINLNSAKAPATKVRRIERFRTHILDGKGAQER